MIDDIVHYHLYAIDVYQYCSKVYISIQSLRSNVKPHETWNHISMFITIVISSEQCVA